MALPRENGIRFDVTALQKDVRARLDSAANDTLVLGPMLVNDEEAWRMCDRMLQDEANLLRILVARKHDPEESTNLFFEQVRFRTRWNPSEVDPSSIKTALSSGAWRLCGYSKDGCPISNFKLHLWNPNQYEGDLDDRIAEYTRFVCYMLELTIARMKTEKQFVVLFDLKGFTPMMVLGTSFRLMIRKLIYVAQSQYPERLRKVYLLNAPSAFATAWSLTKPILDEKTVKKVKFAKSYAMILDDVDESVLSVAYGGIHEEYPIPSGSIAQSITEESTSQLSQPRTFDLSRVEDATLQSSRMTISCTIKRLFTGSF